MPTLKALPSEFIPADFLLFRRSRALGGGHSREIGSQLAAGVGRVVLAAFDVGLGLDRRRQRHPVFAR